MRDGRLGREERDLANYPAMASSGVPLFDELKSRYSSQGESLLTSSRIYTWLIPHDSILSSGGSTPRRSRRGDIHSSLPFSSPSVRPRRDQDAPLGSPAGVRSSSPPIGANFGLTSEIGAPTLSMAGSGPDGNENTYGEGAGGDGKFIWGTTVALQESMNLFTDFLRNFKPKYRAAYNKVAKIASEDEDDAFAPPAPAPNALYDNLTNTKANETLYLTYIRTMRMTQQTNLNLDAINLLSYPPTKKLYHQLIAYPQEVIPIMDQVLKDLMIELANEDAENMEEGLEKDLLVEDAREMAARVYKVRPFGGERTVNMRDLNPGGESGHRFAKYRPGIDAADCSIDRHRQAGLDQGFGYQSDSSHSRYEARYVLHLDCVCSSTNAKAISAAFFRCMVCQHTVQEEIDRGRINEPNKCPREQCKAQGTMSLIHNRSEFADKQVVRLQETPGEYRRYSTSDFHPS